MECEVEFPVPRSCLESLSSKPDTGNPRLLSDDEIIDSTFFFVSFRFRFFSGQFGFTQYPQLHHGFGPELFCFPKRIGRRLSSPASLSETLVADESESKLSSDVKRYLQSLRKPLKLDEEGFYKSHKGYIPTRIDRAHDVTFCDFETMTADEKSYNSRYLTMRLDELIMQAWDFKLLALSAFGNPEDLGDCKFSQCDSILQYFDVQSDHFAKKFRIGSLWDAKLSQKCEACASKRIGSSSVLRSRCSEHVYDYLNDDLEGLEYVRRQSSFLRRSSFSKQLYAALHEMFVLEKRERKLVLPLETFFRGLESLLRQEDVTDRNSSIADRHPLMWKLVSSPSEGRRHETLMSRCDYRGTFNAFFEPSIDQGIDPPDFFHPRFPVNLYDNERYELAEDQNLRHYPVTSDGKAACTLSSRPSQNNSHHFRSIFGVLESIIHPPRRDMAAEDESERSRTEAEFTSCIQYFNYKYIKVYIYMLRRPNVTPFLQGLTVWAFSALLLSEESSMPFAIFLPSPRKTKNFSNYSVTT